MGKIYGFIAGTELSRALMTGLLLTSAFRPDQVVVSDLLFPEICYKEIRNKGVNVWYTNQLIMNECAVVFLDMLPDVLKSTLKKLLEITCINSSKEDLHPLFVSLVPGISIQNLEELLEPLTRKPRVIRLLANTSCSVQQGCCAYAVGRNVFMRDCNFIEEKFSKLGICEKVFESNLDVLSGIAFSGQSIIYSAIEAIADGGVKLGLDKDMALRFAVNTALGSTSLLQKILDSTPLHPAIPRITEWALSPSTSAATHFLEEKSIRDSLKSAVEVAVLRTREDAQKEISKPVDTYVLAVESHERIQAVVESWAMNRIEKSSSGNN